MGKIHKMGDEKVLWSLAILMISVAEGMVFLMGGGRLVSKVIPSLIMGGDDPFNRIPQAAFTPPRALPRAGISPAHSLWDRWISLFGTVP